MLISSVNIFTEASRITVDHISEQCGPAELTHINHHVGPYCLQILKLQYSGHLMRRADSLEKTLMLGKIEGKRKRGWQRMRWLDGITDQWKWIWVNSGSWWWTGRPGMLQSMGSQRVRHNWVNWTELNWNTENQANKVSRTKRWHSPDGMTLCENLDLACLYAYVSWADKFPFFVKPG